MESEEKVLKGTKALYSGNVQKTRHTRLEHTERGALTSTPTKEGHASKPLELVTGNTIPWARVALAAALNRRHTWLHAMMVRTSVMLMTRERISMGSMSILFFGACAWVRG